MSSLNAYTALIAETLRAGVAWRHRVPLVLAGDRPWCREWAAAVLPAGGRILCLGGSADGPAPLAGAPCLPASSALSLLGQEVDALVFDAHAGFDPDAFGAASGAVRGGGLLCLLTPPLEDWPRWGDPERARITVAPYPPEAVTGRYLERLARVVRNAPGVTLVEQGRPLPPAPQAPTAAAREDFRDPHCLTADQRRAVDAIVRVVRGQRRRPLVLTSDRGRGKSAALGIAAAELLGVDCARIVITGPSLGAVSPAFEQAGRIRPAAALSRATLVLDGARMDFVAPDELARSPVPADLLLVDEAATIPAPLLERLLRSYARVVFATTVHGYEGTGRGFALRFDKALDRYSRGWRGLQMETPIRWARDDPGEGFVLRALMLDAVPAPDESLRDATPAGCSYGVLDRDELAGDEAALRELFGLLVLAHYKTRPYDLRQLLDGPNLRVYAGRREGSLAATALLAREGGFDAATARRIWEGRRRPQGHLIPETLAAHLGLEEGARLRAARIMRIAVHPRLQGRGIGSRLLEAILAQQVEEDLDYVGSSFGATTELLRFWGRGGFRPVRVGVRRGATSGAHSVLMLRALSPAGAELLARARARYLDGLPQQLMDPLRDLEADLALALLPSWDEWEGLELDRQDWLDLVAFGCGARLYESALAPIWRLSTVHLMTPGRDRQLDEGERRALMIRVMQRRSWQETAALLGHPGRAQVVAQLRGAIRTLTLHHGPPELRQELEGALAASRERGQT